MLLGLVCIPGLYVVGPKLVSTKLHWLPLQDSGSNAIWYSNKLGIWIIGSQDAIGQKILPASIISFDDVERPQEVTTWQYYDGKMFIPIDDILVVNGTYLFVCFKGRIAPLPDKLNPYFLSSLVPRVTKETPGY